MKRLVHKFVAQGGDWGRHHRAHGLQATELPHSHQYACVFPAEIDQALFPEAGAIGLSADEKGRLRALQFVYQKGIA